MSSKVEEKEKLVKENEGARGDFYTSSAIPKLAHSSPMGAAGPDSVRSSASKGGQKKSAAKNYFDKINANKRQ